MNMIVTSLESYKFQFIETVTAVVVFLTLKFTLRYFVGQMAVASYFKIAERKDILKLINLILLILFFIIVVAIWSVKQENILIFASSLLTVFGVAMFAEMSILSNVTAYLILFFQHPLKINDTIIFAHEGTEIQGELIDITYFFAFIKTKDRGILTIPNALLIKSSFSVLARPTDSSKNGT